MMGCRSRMNSTDNSPCVNTGQIQVIFGPMFSGKTTELMRRIKRFEIANYSCLVIKYAKDDRYDKEGVATHDRQVIDATSTEQLNDVLNLAENHEVIGIDEGQFFPDCVPFAEDMANRGKIVVVAALDGTFQRKGFGNILNLVPLAESVVKLNAVCMQCFHEASYTKRMGIETELEVIGGADKYMAVCRGCYNKPDTTLTPEEIGNSQETPVLEGTAAMAKLQGRQLFKAHTTPTITQRS